MISISTQAVTSALRQSVLQMQSDLVKAEQEVSTGRLADVGLSLGAETGQSVSLRQEQARLQAITDTNNTVTTRLTSTSNTLNSLLAGAQSFLQDLVAASSTGSTAAAALQSQAKGNLQSLISGLNTTVEGQYIFGGINTDVKPITDYFQNPPAANKQAVDNAFQTAFGMSQTSSSASSISASAMQAFLGSTFAGLFQGSAWTSDWSAASSQNVRSRISTTELIDTSTNANQPAMQQLAMAYTMVSEFAGSNMSDATRQAVISAATQAVNGAVSQLTDLAAGIGTAQSAVTDANNQMSLQLNILSTGITNLEGVNSYEATAQVNNLQTQIETSYALTNQMRQLSLVNYLTTTG